MKKSVGARIELVKVNRLESIQRHLRLEHFSDLVILALDEFQERHPVPTEVDTDTDTPDDSGPTDPASPSTSDAGADVVEFRPHPAAQVPIDPATGRPRLTRHEIVEEHGEGGIRLPLDADRFGFDRAA